MLDDDDATANNGAVVGVEAPEVALPMGFGGVAGAQTLLNNALTPSTAGLNKSPDPSGPNTATAAIPPTNKTPPMVIRMPFTLLGLNPEINGFFETPDTAPHTSHARRRLF
jgi:hypothetical protein